METITEVQFGSAPEANRYMKSNFPICDNDGLKSGFFIKSKVSVLKMHSILTVYFPDHLFLQRYRIPSLLKNTAFKIFLHSNTGEEWYI